MGKMIWQRYFVREFFKIFFLFLFCFYGLYVMIDYASHTSALAHHSVQLQGLEIIRYYLYVFSSRAEIILPLALLIAFIKTACTLNANNELVALMAGGIPLRKLLQPFIYIGLAFTVLIFLNEQFIIPTALKKLRRIEEATKHQRSRRAAPMAANALLLEDGSTLIYQKFDRATEEFFDVYWVESIDSIYRMKGLSPQTIPPIGFFVDHLQRQPEGQLKHAAAYEKLPMDQIRFSPKLLQSAIFEPEILSLSDLAPKAWATSAEPNEKESKLLTAFYWKLAAPWLCLLAILAPAPFCIRFSRNLPLFYIYVFGLFGFIAFYMLMDSAQVVARRQLIAPFWAICVPFISALGLCWGRFRVQTR